MMNFLMNFINKILFIICFVFVTFNCFGMQKDLINAIKIDESSTVFALLKKDSKNLLTDKNFIEKKISPFLEHRDPRVRGLAALFLFKQIYDNKLKASRSVLAKWKKTALNFGLKDEERVNSSPCSAFIRIMGDHKYANDEHEAYGVVYAIVEPRTVSRPIQRAELDEYYFVVAGEGEVWLKDVQSQNETITKLKPGVAVKVPSTHIVQYRNTGKTLLVLLVPTNPPYRIVGKRTSWNIEKLFETGKWKFKK